MMRVLGDGLGIEVSPCEFKPLRNTAQAKETIEWFYYGKKPVNLFPADGCLTILCKP